MKQIKEEPKINYKTKNKVSLCHEFFLDTKINHDKGVCITESRISEKEIQKIWTENYKDCRLRERFIVLYLNQANELLGYYLIATGSAKGVLVDIKFIIQPALQCGAQSMVLAHNHPSGNTTPSETDKSLTKRVIDAAKLFDIGVLDHIIITPEKGIYTSFADEQLL